MVLAVTWTPTESQALHTIRTDLDQEISYNAYIVNSSFMSQVVSARLPEETVERLKRFARRLGKTPSETGAMLIEESLRQEEFAFIDFRNSPVGRQPYLTNSGLAVWEVMMVAQDYDLDIEAVAHHFQKPTAWVIAACNYAEAYPNEIRLAIEDNYAMSPKALSHLLPQTQVLEVPQTVLEEQP
jgi:uncharacterized protein (DUF433 family)